MAWKSLTELKTAIATNIRSLGIGGLTLASGVRDVLNDFADTIHAGSGTSFEVDDSLEATPALRLKGDEETPTDGKFYGKLAGNKGWFTPPYLDGEFSVEKNSGSGKYRLLNETATPNKSHYYGTNAAGTRGYNPMSAVWFGVQSFTAAPVSTSQISFTDALVLTGYGLRYKIGGTWFYGIITAISSGTATIVGEPASGTITELEFCESKNIEKLPYDLSEKTLILATSSALTAQTTNGNYKPTTWYDAPAKLIAAYARPRVKGSGTNPVVNLRISAFGSDAFGTNLTLAADNTTYGTGVTATPAANTLAFGNSIELRVITENANAKHLNLYLLIIKNI